MQDYHATQAIPGPIQNLREQVRNINALLTETLAATGELIGQPEGKGVDVDRPNKDIGTLLNLRVQLDGLEILARDVRQQIMRILETI